ncbi:methylthioribose kinase-like isoform X1 [Haliotis rubra]|uniref:methylthioribose kinase-like isoform X1 n=1 Tax=Haliotis rubra TaxID=36100 RepID=UPI001EE6336B|nr:methylthioribose kinase-like isoform X1 [Haliotis rubra]
MADEEVSQTDTQGKVLKALKKHSHLAELQWAECISSVKVSEVGDGNLNDVFRAFPSEDPSNSVVVKHAPPYIKCLGKDFPLHEERGELEYKAQFKFHSIAPGSVPKPIFYDSSLRVMCMEDLRNYVIYRSSLISGHLNDDAALKLARDVAIIHRDTHVAKIGEDAIKQLDKEFQNTSTLTLREQLLFTSPFTPGDPSNQCSDAVKARLDWLYGDQEVLRAAADMKRIFLEKKEALVHGDLHTGSIMVKDEDAKITNAGCSYVGPCSLDLGLLVANYIFTYYCHLLCPEDNDNRRVFAYRVVEICNKTVDEYFKHMTSVTEDVEIYQAKLISEMAGFAGCEIIRRLVGPAHVGEFDHTHDAEIDALGAGVRLLKAFDRIHSIGTLMLIALMLA